MKKTIIAIALSLFATTPVFAHIAVQDGPVFAVLHIEPGDSPVVGEPAQLAFNFTGSQEIFDASKCNCSVKISSKGNVLFDKKISEAEFSNDKESVNLTYTFPAKAVYTIVLYGNTGSTASSTSFTLSYDIRVERGNASETPSTGIDWNHEFIHHLGHVIIFGGAFAFGGILMYRDWRKNKKLIK